MITINDVIAYIRPNSSWVIEDFDYDTLIWDSEEPKPTLQEINDAWPDAEIFYKRDRAVLSRADFKLALLEAGYLQDVKDFIASTTDERIIILWEDSNSFRRLHPDLIRLAEELGYTEEQLDALFGIA